MFTEKIGQWVKKRALSFGALLGILSGLCLAYTVQDPPSTAALAGGYMHAFPGNYSGKDLSNALLYQFAPLFIMYLGAYGRLSGIIGFAVLFLRGVASGAGCLFFYRSCEKTGGFVFLFVLLCLTELLILAFCHSCGKLSLFFSKATQNRIHKKTVKTYTLDMLFFTGMVFIFYLLRGCVTALLNS